MFDDEKFNNVFKAQCFISKDVIRIFKWLMEYEPEALKKIIIKAINKGIKNDKDLVHQDPATLNNYILDFFIMLENIFYEILTDSMSNSELDKKLLSIIDQFDLNSYNLDDVELSILKVNNDKNLKKSNEQLKSILCKEILKRWKPAKKDSLIN
jgi:hypothetical protein